MSTNPALGHLYHDQNISSTLTTLNLQEKMKTRAINAREMRHLNEYTRSIDRAKGVYKRHYEWEQKNLRHQLKNIEWKTPSLAKSLRTESERQKILRPSFSAAELVLPKLNNCDKIVSTDELNVKEEHHPMFVSSWSVYSNRRTQVRSAPELYRKSSVYEVGSFRPRYSPDGDNTRTRIAGVVKNAEQVTKTLHKLYTQSLQRKVKEQQTTVLDVLGRESKEELEKALFVLRGTPAGDLIEEILKDKEYVTKQQKESNNNELGIENDSVDQRAVNGVTGAPEAIISDGIPEFPRNDQVGEGSDTNNTDFDNIKRETIDYNGVTHHGSAISIASVPAGKLLLKRQSRNTSKHVSDVNDMFERDESWYMSSTIANASDTGRISHGLRWTDIFKTPELWKQNKRNKNGPLHKKDVSLVTLTGKRRHTLLNKR